MSNDVFLNQPKDKSLEAYKQWITEMAKALGEDTEGEEPSDAEWEASWKRFWEKAAKG